MKKSTLLGGVAALAFAGVAMPRPAQAADSIDKEAMRTAIKKHQQESYILGGLTLAGGLASGVGGFVFLLHPKNKDRRKLALPLLVFGALQEAAAGWILGSAFSQSFYLDYLEFTTPAEFREIALPRPLREANTLKIGLIADLAITGLSIPLLLPVDYFRDWFGMGVLMVVEGVFSFVTGYAYYSTIESYKSSLERYSKFVAPPMGPQSARPIMFDVKFAF